MGPLTTLQPTILLLIPTVRIVQSFEVIAISLTQQENFTEFEVENENIAVRIENVSRQKF